jgi:hypothetical protein
MSLIEEALRRQREETQGTHGAATPAPAPPPTPASPPALPPAPATPSRTTAHTLSPKAPAPALAKAASPKPRKTSRVWPTVLIVVAVLLLLAFAGVYLVLKGLHHWVRDRDSATPELAHGITPQPPTRPDSHAPEPASVATTPDTAPALPAAAVAPASSIADAIAFTQRIATASTPASNVAAVAVAVASPTPPTSARAIVPPVKPDVPPKTAVPVAERNPVKWPRVVLSGTIRSGRFSSAQLNGKIVGVGESTDGITVLGVEYQGALLEFDGEQRFFKVRAGN